MPERRDYLSVCNDQGVPLTDFQATFCIRCMQPECSRSRAGGLFETRVATWEERLFKSPARMADSDPRYALITAKRFVEVHTGRVPEIGGAKEWMDPRALEAPEILVAKPRAARAQKVHQPAEEPGTPEDPVAAPTAPLNTPFAQGAMLVDNSPAPAPKPSDRWASAPAPDSTGPLDAAVPIVKAGAKIRFGA